jgi:YbgC/YbaW family acyl-CoA thioester hydrolase
MMKRSEFRFFDRLRVRWAEVDLQKIVFNGHYLMYVDTAVSGYWRTLALPYHDTMHALGGDLYVRKATLEYLGSARYDDVLEVGLRCGRIGNSSLTFQAAVFRGEQCLVHGEIVYVFADPATQTSRPVPEALRRVLNGFEAGEPVLELRVGSWAELGTAAQQVRQPVFVHEQGIAPELVVDEADAGAVHAVAFNRLGVPVAAGRLLQPSRGLAQVGRMATLASVRGGQMGGTVLNALMQAARDRGDVAMVLHAQSTAVGFYERHGFTPEGEGFQTAGIPHQTMRRVL